MIDGRTRLVLAIAAAGLAGVTGCNSGPVDTHPVNHDRTHKIYMKIRHEGAIDLTEVEEIMGGKGVEIPNPCQPQGGFEPQPYVFTDERYRGMEYKFNGKMKLIRGPAKDNGNKVMWLADVPPPGETGSVVTWLRWGDEARYLRVAVLEGKVVWSESKGLPSLGRSL